MREEIKQALKKVYDPEIPVDIYELGLIYDVIEKDNHVDINMTLQLMLILYFIPHGIKE
jgi:metal-sulfur cluster biosynthetic enzyme